jgi:hypothetical protein
MGAHAHEKRQALVVMAKDFIKNTGYPSQNEALHMMV